MTTGERPRRDQGDRYQDKDDDRSWQRANHGLDLLLSPADGPREPWLRQTLERSGALAWPGRHRRLLGGLTALLVVVAVGVEYLVTRPPPPDPVVDVAVVGVDQGTSSSDFDAQGRVRARLSYQVTAHAVGDVITALGVVGPGLSNPTSTIPRVRFTLPKAGTLGATVDCSDSAWWSAKDADYRARVRRTDTHGGVTTYDAPLDQSNASWHNGVRGSCLTSFFEALPAATGTASAIPGKHALRVTLTLTNPSRDRVPRPVDAAALRWHGLGVVVPARRGLQQRRAARAVRQDPGRRAGEGQGAAVVFVGHEAPGRLADRWRVGSP
jgi:hypothetical protein